MVGEINKFKASKVRFHQNEETLGYCHWEVEVPHTNFKLECWTMRNYKGVFEPHIVQFWDMGNGYKIWR